MVLISPSVSHRDDRRDGLFSFRTDQRDSDFLYFTFRIKVPVPLILSKRIEELPRDYTFMIKWVK